MNSTDARIRHLILMAVSTQGEPTEAHLFADAEQRGLAREDVERVLLAMLDAGEIRSTLIPFTELGPVVRHYAAVTRPFGVSKRGETK